MTYYPEVYSFEPGAVILAKGSTILRYAKEIDVPAIDALRKKESQSLGMIHLSNYLSVATKTRQYNRDRWKSQHLLVIEDNNDITGFAYISYFQPLYAEIIQLMVREDARRVERALMVVDFLNGLSLKLGKSCLRARVAWDIDAVAFWVNIGFHVTAIETSTHLNRGKSKSQRPLYIFEKPVTQKTRQLLFSPNKVELEKFPKQLLKLSDLRIEVK